ncbi:unnamed protein product [Schistosoma rodhaini]|uniref:Integrator complex subunit 4 n=3 Tax=Schistosoma rodhaini TaxID=6188 RepID=A0AA85GFB0_9TREM|nr:unnamed protein product [Schistosoma rodhaini]
MLISECEKFLTKLRALPPTATQELSVLGVINEAFACPSAHVRSGCLDLLAGWNSPQICLSAGSAGEVVLWHTADGDPRVRDRSFHCLLTWLCSLNAVLKSSEFSRPGKAKYFNNHKESVKKELTGWFETNLESVYSAACQGLLDNEELVRRTSLHVLGKLSTIWPHHSLTDVPVFSLNSLLSSKICLDSDLEETQLVDDAFIRVCCRLQDPSRSVRQLAAHIMADLAKFVTENCLLQTLEKTVMSDRQVRRSMIESDNKSKNKKNKSNNNNLRSTVDNRSQTKNLTSDSINLISTGCNGAIISGLEDDYFEIRCTTLATVTHIASLNTRFALNCQDLLVDMLTDDIQDVRLAAVRALSAVGDKVPVKSEQVSIITSALAEGSGRIRRRLHHLLSQCRLASAPCLISLLDGLLQNLRRYPEDRDNLWRCAASVGRNHPIFVETCLSSLLRTHSWLSGPEPVKEDPAYLTVLLLVLNAEPSIPGMLAKFPRHVASTKIYLQELLPSLLPKTVVNDEFQNVSPLDLPNKKLCLTTDADDGCTLNGPSIMEHCSLYKFIASTICRICKLFLMIYDELSSYCLSLKQEEKCNNLHRRIPCYKYQSHRNTLLSHLIFNDLMNCIKKLNHNKKLKNLLYWLILLSTIGWYLISANIIYHYHSMNSLSSSSSSSTTTTTTSSSTTSRTSSSPTLSSINNNLQLNHNFKEKFIHPIYERIIKLLNKAIRNSLKINHLFSGKTKYESIYVSQLCSNTFNLFQSFTNDHHQINVNYLLDALHSIINLLSNSNQPENNITSMPIHHYSNTRKRSFPTIKFNMEQFNDDYVILIDYLIDLSNRLIPVYAVLLQPSSNSSNLMNIDNNHNIDTRSTISLNKYQPDHNMMIMMNMLNENDLLNMNTNRIDLPTSSSFSHISGNNVVPEIRFTAIIASAMIRIRAIIIGLNIEMARKHICIIFRRPDLLVSHNPSTHNNTKNIQSKLYHWWPPSNSWHQLDDDTISSSTSTINQDHLEIRTHIELTAGRWSDSGTINLGIGYCLQSTDCSFMNNNICHNDDSTYHENSTNDHWNHCILDSSLIIPLTPIPLLSKVKLVPCAPINQW